MILRTVSAKFVGRLCKYLYRDTGVVLLLTLSLSFQVYEQLLYRVACHIQPGLYRTVHTQQYKNQLASFEGLKRYLPAFELYLKNMNLFPEL